MCIRDRAQILRAEGSAQARVLEAQDQAQAIQQVFDAIHRGKPTQRLLAYQYLQVLPQMCIRDRIKAEVEGLLADLRAQRDGVVWIPEMLPRREVIALLTASTVFACPSVYEPLGIVNLEAMACELPVVATATGGIPEVVMHGETGWLVPIEQVQDGTGTPVDAEKFVSDLAGALTDAVSNRERARAMGLAGRARAVDHFSWESIGDKTMAVYQDVLGRA